MNKLKNFFKDIRLREKLLLFYLIGGILPLVLADVYMYSSVRNVMLEQEKQATLNELTNIADSISECISVTEEISKRLYFNESIEHIAFTSYRSYDEILKDYRDCDTVTDFIRYYYQEIAGITIYMYNPTISDNEYFVYADEKKREDLHYVETVSRAGAPYWYYAYDDVTGKYHLRLARVLYTTEMERVGVAVLQMQNKRSELPITEREDDTFFLYNDEIVLHSNATEKDGRAVLRLMEQKSGDSYAGRVVYRGEDYLLSFVKLHPPYCDDFYTVASLRPYREIAALATATAFGNIVPMLLCVAVAVALILIFSNYFSGRINIFKDEMHRAATGDFTVTAALDGRDEIAELHDDLISMIRDIQELMDRVVQEQVQKEQLNTRQKEVEFKMLASQINPHFLYNTLETIRMQARVNGQPEIEELTKMLAKLMRRNIQATDSLQPLRAELQLVEYYLKIQDYRFHDRIRYEIITDERARQEELFVMPLLIQPFVENAYAHGLESKESGGLIKIRVELRTHLWITVEDNGCGMEKERLEEVRNSLNDFDNLDRTHIGICNVNQRIRIRYGDHYGVTIESTAGEGTSVTIKLPLLS